MFSLKRFLVFMVVAIFAISTAVAQLTVEESYLMDAIEAMIIREAARSNSREQKLIALTYIADAIERGNTSSDIQDSLVFLSGEGRTIIAREGGRVVNNFPDVRLLSARYLGRIGTEDAARALNDILLFENEPMVLLEVIRALGEIGFNENNETVTNIVWVVRRFDSLNPNNLLALAAIDTFESFAMQEGSLSTDAIQLLIQISSGNYIRPVQDRARQLIADIRRMHH